ncbi:MAG: hypothetical protein E4H03_09875 [Myxococcales bacterium]|nr:MAG: hypothetical protein E4H03_09875 [Myxococcales bacterium]
MSPARCTARNPEMGKGKAAALAEFKRLLVDPDPASMAIAEDVLLEAGLKLADVGELLAAEGRENLEPGPHEGWASDFPSAGQFVIGSEQNPAAIGWTAVSWIVWKFTEHVPEQGVIQRRSRGWLVTGYRIEIIINYGGQTWSEVQAGPNNDDNLLTLAALENLSVHDLRALPPVVPSLASHVDLARARAIATDLSWQIAKEMKEQDLIGGSASDLITAVRYVTPERTPPEVVNPPMTAEEAGLHFRELVQDSDPESLDVALDVLEETGLTLAQVSEQWLRSEPHTSLHTRYRTARRFAGLFVLADTDDDFTDVQWMVVEKRPNSRQWTISIEGYFHSEPWLYDIGEPYHLVQHEAVTRAVTDAWFAVNVMRRHWGDSPRSVAQKLERGARGGYDEATLQAWRAPVGGLIA